MSKKIVYAVKEKLKSSNYLKIIALFIVTLSSVSIIISDNNKVFAISHNLSVSTEDDVGNPLTAYWVDIKQNGISVASGFSAAEFTLAPGNYLVAVGDYGGQFFNHWNDGTTTRTISIAITSASTVSLTAVYSTSPQGTIVGPSIEVDSAYSDGSALSGMYVQLSQGGVLVDQGFTPTAFPVTEGMSYEVAIGDYTGAFFNHWSTGQITRTMTVTASASSTQLDAIYTTTPQPPPPGQVGPNSVTVISEFLDGAPTTENLYVQIRVDGSVLTEGYTPVTFSNLEPGQEYSIVVYNDKDNWFRHYSDGLLTRYHTVIPGPDPITLTAKYEKVPKTLEARLDITAIDQFGNILGDTTGSVEQGNIVVTPGMWVPITPPGQTTPYTGGFTGGSGFPFYGFNGQTYTVEMTSYQQYQFSHWEIDGSTNPIRSFTMNGNSLNNVAIYNVIS